jgi:hypothetical protein
MCPFRTTLPAGESTYEHRAQNDSGHISTITIRRGSKIRAKQTSSLRRGYARRWLWWTCDYSIIVTGTGILSFAERGLL